MAASADRPQHWGARSRGARKHAEDRPKRATTPAQRRRRAWFWKAANLRPAFWALTIFLSSWAVLDWFAQPAGAILTKVAQGANPILAMPLWWFKSLLVDLHTPQSFAQSVFESSVASFWIAWTLYLNRRWITTLFQPPPIRLFAPMSIAVAPLIVGRERNLWVDHGVNLDVAFSTTGGNALEELSSGDCLMAVAGDYATWQFFKTVKNWDREPYRLLPFARLTNEVKLLVPPTFARTGDTTGSNGSATEVTLEDLRGRRVCYWPGSIHEEFIRQIGLNCVCANMESDGRDSPLMTFMSQTLSGEAAACVLVEPYFVAFERLGYKIVQTQSTLTWYMCFVMKERLFREFPDLESRLPRAVGEACSMANKNWEDTMRSCADYVLREFTGIDMNSLLKNMPPDRVRFEIPTNEEFEARIAQLCGQEGDPVGKGTLVPHTLTQCLLL